MADLHNSTAIAMTVPLVFFVAAWSYALCVNFVPSYRDPADKFRMTEIGLNMPVDEETASPVEPTETEKVGLELQPDSKVIA